MAHRNQGMQDFTDKILRSDPPKENVMSAESTGTANINQSLQADQFHRHSDFKKKSEQIKKEYSDTFDKSKTEGTTGRISRFPFAKGHEHFGPKAKELNALRDKSIKHSSSGYVTKSQFKK
jgi:hypothetical protein